MTKQTKTPGAMVLVQRGTLEKIAAMKNGGGDEPNGSGYDMCPVCFGEGKWRWKSGSVAGVDPIAHDADCSLEAIRALLSSPAAQPPAVGGEPYRSPENYAIEHAEYMATSADSVLAKFQAYGLALLAVDEGGDDGEGELFEAIDNARGDLQESLVDLRSMVYEFRKRSSRCTHGSPVSTQPRIAELEAAQGEAVALTVWYGPMPESNGKSNLTAILHRKGECISKGICIDRSEYPERTRYEADHMRHLIGELSEEPDILAYDADKHSGYLGKAQPATAKVVLPERRAAYWGDDTQSTQDFFKEVGFNDCLDEVAKLNGGA